MVDANFANPAFADDVWSIGIQTDGRILAGGWFRNAGGTSRNYVARLNADGTLDTSFVDPQFDNVVYSLAIQSDGRVVVGGFFERLGSPAVPFRSLVRLTTTGELDSTFENPNLNNTLSFVTLQPDGKLLAAGNFTTAGVSSASYKRLARFNASIVTLSVTNPTNGAVTSSVGGINCGTTCTAQVASGTSLTLTATPASGYGFTAHPFRDLIGPLLHRQFSSVQVLGELPQQPAASSICIYDLPCRPHGLYIRSVV